MDWLDGCIDRLIAGDCLNVTGLAGSGRSESLRRIEASLESSDWVTLWWNSQDVLSIGRSQMLSAIELLTDPHRIPVLFIDDFGSLLTTSDGMWLERVLFSKVHEVSDDSRPTLRCVLATHPRDREIVGPGSALRERCRHLAPDFTERSEPILSDFGCDGTDQLIALTGGNSYVLAAGGRTSHERRGVAGTIASQRLPHWVGQLDHAHQRRLSNILSRTAPARWRTDDADPILARLVVRSPYDTDGKCLVPECITTSNIQDLLVGEPWPERSIDASARRLAARCGNEPSPIWVDNFLSDLRRLDPTRLLHLLGEWLRISPSIERLRVLSRNWVGSDRIYAADIVHALEAGGLSDTIRTRIEWRIYDQRSVANLHRRELLLPRRGTAFTLPPADIVCGQTEAGNETDATTSLSSSSVTRAIWDKAVRVIG